jgi:molybdopterin-guanine dinucleotide biosynthesis protein A
VSAGARLLGAVLAGGEGRRFGAPKGDAIVAGVSLVRRAVDALAGVAGDVVVVSSRPVAENHVEVLEDAVPGAGPLAGLTSALDAAAARGLDGVLLLACDLPLVSAATLRAVRDALGGRTAVAPRRDGGGIEPLCAAWAVSVRAAARARLAAGDRSLHALFREVGGVPLDPKEVGATPEGSFLNVNTPGDRDRAEAALQAREGGEGA